MSSWKEIWNSFVNCRQVWSNPGTLEEFFYSNMFLYASMVVIFTAAMAYMAYLEWAFRRHARREEAEFQTWKQEWDARPQVRIGDDEITPARFPWLFENKRELLIPTDVGLKMYTPQVVYDEVFSADKAA